MKFQQAIKRINTLLRKEKPKTFSSSWIYYRDSCIYQFIAKSIRTDAGDINWDKVVHSLDKKFQKLWYPKRHNPKHKVIKFYYDQQEVELILKSYKQKLYVFAVALSLEDHKLRDVISIALVRIAQKGNKRAEEKLIFFLDQLIQLWFEKYPYFYCWVGRREEMQAKVKHCIYYYRFTGSFLGYLFKTLEYSGRAFPKPYSLDACIPGTTLQTIDTLTRDPQTGRVVKAADIGFYYFR
jgi:hypothetical protein